MNVAATIRFSLNGEWLTVTSDPDRPLLDVLREDLQLTGTKYGCGETQCGACSVLMDGKRVFSCRTAIKLVEGKTIVTIEGLAEGDKLHPVQQAFLEEEAFPCGYCSTEKGSYVATCAEVALQENAIRVRRVCQVFECGKVINPANLTAQVQGCIIMGLGPALREEMRFEGGRMLNAAFSEYLVPRFEDVPEIEVHLLDRPDLPSAGAGETPLITISAAIGNAVFHASGKRIRQMPIRLDAPARA